MPETQTVRELDINQIKNAIPHRWPFLLVDRVKILEEGKKAVGYKYVTFNENFFQGHFPQKPVMPGVLIVEALAQTACAMMLAGAPASGGPAVPPSSASGGLGTPELKGKIAFFMGINNVKFRAPVIPGCFLELRVEILRSGSRAGKAKGEAYINGETLACEGEFTFALVDGTN